MTASKHVLIAYYSQTGNTARVAGDLAKRLDADLECIRTDRTGLLGRLADAFDAWRGVASKIKPLQWDPADYSIVIVGTPVWGGRMTPAVRAYLNQTSGKLRSVAFFVTSGDTDVQKLLPSLEAAAGRRSMAAAGFNAKELRDTSIYQTKLSDFVEQIARVAQSPRKAA